MKSQPPSDRGRPSAEALRRIADDLHLDLASDRIEILVEMLGPLLDAALDEVPSTAAVPLGREVLGRPGAGEDPCNAIRLRCRVAPTSEGLLSGRRVGVKDSICVAGIPLSCGSRLLEDFVPTRDATVVTRLLAEGAEITAVLNMDDMAVSATGDTCAWGAVLNPNDLGHLAGGSSGGSAAALFGDEVDLTLGGDQGGSIRVPASWCGCAGLKPTYGLVPYTGILGADASFDHVGPMARRVEDVALLLDAIAGADPDDPRQGAVPEIDARGDLERGARGLRIGVVKEGFSHPAVDREVAACVREALERLAGQGAHVSEVSIPAHVAGGRLLAPLLCEGFSSLVEYGGVMRHLGGRHDPDLARALRRALPERARHLSLMAKLLLVLGRYVRETTRGSVYAAAQNARPALRAAYDRALDEVDVLAMPTTPTTAARHEAGQDEWRRMASNLQVTANTAPFDLSGHPSLSVPCGRIGGLPVGLMLTGRRLGDATVLRAGLAVERSAG